MKRIVPYITTKREERKVMSRLRKAWRLHEKRIPQMPFPTDEELLELYRRMPVHRPLPQPVPPKRHTAISPMVRTVLSAAMAAVVLSIVLPGPAAIASNLGGNSVEAINSINQMII